jgi:hypothetical protein
MNTPLDRRITVAPVIALAMTIGLAACDLKVSNPGPVSDDYLNVNAAHDAVVNGAIRAFNDALGTNGSNFAMCGAVVAREWFPSGQTGSFACSLQEMRNQLTPQGSSEWDRVQLARWVTENGVARIKTVRRDSFRDYSMAALAMLYVGYVNRMAGEHVCTTVIDGGPELPFTMHFARAESAFTEALSIAQYQKNTNYTQAAYAGRASVRVWRGNWTGAAEDAALVPANYVFSTPFNTVDQTQSNSLAIATVDVTRRNFTLWNTFYGDNYDQFKDPRTPYRKNPEIAQRNGLGTVPDLGDGKGIYGAVPYWQQRKYITDASALSNAPIRLSSGREMLLISAEAKLRAGDFQAALTIINQIRSTVGVALRTATTSDQTWTWLKLEKLIELWLEGRALGERRRWFGDGADKAAPGDLPATLRMDDRTGKDRCFPISLNEYNTNPNLTPPPG